MTADREKNLAEALMRVGWVDLPRLTRSLLLFTQESCLCDGAADDGTAVEKSRHTRLMHTFIEG